MAEPTAEELNVLKVFRENVKDLGLEKATDLNMLRWLRAREMNLDASEQMLRKHMKWRMDEDLDHVLEWVPPYNFPTEFRYEITGHDSEGHPILVIPFGEWDVRKIMTSNVKGMREVWLRHIDQMFARSYEDMKQMSAKLGREITQGVVIVDFADFSMRQLTSFANISTILEAVRRFEANYPEILFRFYFVNAFRVFQMFFAMMKPLLSVRTIAKLEIYTTPDKWVPVLLAHLPKDQLPVEFGGTQITRRISKGNSIDLGSENLDAAEMVSVDIPAGESLKLEFQVNKPKSTLKWAFRTQSNDIGFSVTFGKDEMVANKRLDASENDVVGTLLCKKAGDYFLIFDNSYSRFRMKTVLYSVDIIEPTS